ncbi:phage portal protein [Schinkia azotoformans]|uniref:phage portal protein n=1 Tax=Schinkia azotoformans TaxID=1454 RepID=UPI002DBB9D27|nr:phage portal protein [Schinkia azotoformans]MEC1780067.1 phage portal protein [Schinkia azotoformans]MED4330854.1 phage portal protein [Schinkia azotoformans]
MEINESLFLTMYEEFKIQRAGKLRYKKYYDGEHDILTNYTMSEDQSNMKLVFNFPKKFVTSLTGYSLGQPINYISKIGDEEVVKLIDKHFGYWEKAHNQKLSKNADIFGEAYEINYINKQGEFHSMVTTPLDMYVLTDGTPENNVIVGIHNFTKRFEKVEYLDVYVGNEILHYSIIEGKLIYISKDEHIFDTVPINICQANDESECVYKDIITLVNVYNIINSDLSNEISDHRNSMLKIMKANIEEEDLKRMKKLGVILVPDGANVDWLIKNINDDFVQNMINNIEQKIYDLMDMVNFNEQWASNTSNVALKNKLLALSHRCTLKEAMMEKTLLRRVRNFFKFIKVKENIQYDYRDLKVKFTRDLPFDLVGLADAISKLENIVSQHTLLTLLPFVENADYEMEKFNKEKELNRIALDDKGDGNA